jgi:hypothetical protein
MTLCKRKKMQYQYAPLMGEYKPDLKDFFPKTSLEGLTTWSKGLKPKPAAEKKLSSKQRKGYRRSVLS